jgi:hypothetical protein
MKIFLDCDYCGSAGSVEFNMCQVCYRDYSKDDDFRGERPRTTALAAEIDRITAAGIRTSLPMLMRGAVPS